MARPKSTGPIKSEVTSVRLTKEQKEEIIILFGSVQAFLDVAIVTNIKKGKKK
jgi:hypothetical protein